MIADEDNEDKKKEKRGRGWRSYIDECRQVDGWLVGVCQGRRTKKETEEGLFN